MRKRQSEIVPLYYGLDQAARERLAMAEYPGCPVLPCIGGPTPGAIHGGKPGTRLYLWVREADLPQTIEDAHRKGRIVRGTEVMCVPIDNETRPAPSEAVMLSELVNLRRDARLLGYYEAHDEQMLTAFFWEGGGRWPE